MEGESIRDFITASRKMAATCNFGSFLPTALRNQFTCGIKANKIKDRLLEIKGLTLDRAVELAQGMESSQHEMQQKAVNFVTRTKMHKKVNNFTQNPKPFSNRNPNTNSNLNNTGFQSMQGNTKLACYRCEGPHWAK